MKLTIAAALVAVSPRAAAQEQKKPAAPSSEMSGMHHPAGHMKHAAADTAAKAKKAVVKAVYTCPMHPEIKSDKPGTCPKCKMDLVEVKPAQKPAKKASKM